MFSKVDVFKNFENFKRKSLCQSLFLNKLAVWRPLTLLKIETRHRCFPVNFSRFSSISFLIDHHRVIAIEANADRFNRLLSRFILGKIYTETFTLRAGLPATRSELKQTGLRFHFGVKFHLVWGNFIISVHMTSGVLKLASVQISLQPNWPKWNFKPQRFSM